jgi:hypothetical protein
MKLAHKKFYCFMIVGEDIRASRKETERKVEKTLKEFCFRFFLFAILRGINKEKKVSSDEGLQALCVFGKLFCGEGCGN